MKKGITVIIAVTLVLVLAACSISSNLDLFNRVTPTATQTALTIPTPVSSAVLQGQDLSTIDLLLTNIYERSNPGVVSIVTSTSEGESSGSGFVYDKEGHIITNYHVVEGAKIVEVDFPSGRKVEGKVIGTDLDSDIAVIEVDVDASQLVPLPLGDSDALKVGQMVVAIGNPFRLNSTMTFGIVSAKGRVQDSIRTAADQTAYASGDLIQIDAAINPGNSGGPLLNMEGEVVGVNRSIRISGTSLEGESINTGIGFAVSINIVKRVVPYLIQYGTFQYPYLGISSSSDDMTLAMWRAVSENQTTGAYITSVTPGGPADQAGLRAGTKPTNIQGLYSGGDIIIGVDGHPVNLYGDLISYIFKYKSPGDEIILTIIRNGEQKEVPLTLGGR